MPDDSGYILIMIKKKKGLLDLYKAYFYEIKIIILNNMEFQFDFVLSIFLTSLNILFYVFFWLSVYGNSISVDGVNLRQMLLYSVVSNFLFEVYEINVSSEINENARTGNISYLLTKPMNLMKYWLFMDLGQAVINFVRCILPIGVTVIFGSYFHIHISIIIFFAFLISSVLAYIIMWHLSFMIGLISIWKNELGTIVQLKDILVSLLSGSFLPLWFFPVAFQRISCFLPFQYMYQIPLGILIGKYQGCEIYKNITIQLAWAIGFLILSKKCYQIACKKVSVQGRVHSQMFAS